MTYLLLGVAAIAVTCQNICKQKYNFRSSGGVFFFGGMIALFAMLWFALWNREWIWNPALIIPASGFALSYATATVFTVLAIRHGPLAKTALINSCSLLIPTFFGILILKEPISATLILGLALLIVALALINNQKRNREAKPLTWRWVVFVSLAAIGNGMCSTVQKAEQLRFGDAGKNVFMIMALGMVSVFGLVLSFVLMEERVLWKISLKKGWHWALLCGVANGLTNTLVLSLYPRLPVSVVFPVISASAIVLSFLYATLIAKERYSACQKLGFAIGVLSVILLNIS